MKILLRLAYNGTRYSGWQVQNNAVTIQQTLQDAILAVFGERYAVTGCSRTDSGVHANDFCCTINMPCDINIPEDKIPIALNHNLPNDISVLHAEFTDDEFHARYDVKYKEYEYLIWNSSIRNPFYENLVYEFPKKLDETIMNEAAKAFIGKHDFASFMSSGSSVENTFREIKYFNVTRENELIRINVASDGFLYNMVRILVGTLIEVSEGKISKNDIPDIINSKNRKMAGFTAPPQGLYLNKVVY